MAWTKAKTTILAGAVVLLALSGGLEAAKIWFADKNNFETEGYYESYGNKHPFTVYVSGNKWLIRETINTNGILYIEDAYDGKYAYRYIQLDGGGNGINKSTGEVQEDDIPDVSSLIVPVWLAYGASRYFDNVAETKLKPFLIASGLRHDRDNLLEVEWQRAKQAPFVPIYIYCKAINYRYQVTAFTNYQGLAVPSEFVFETFPIGVELTNTPKYSVHGFLTKIKSPASIKNFRPKIDGHTYTTDRRFPGVAPGETGVATYMNVSKDWFSTNSPQWQALLKLWDTKSGNLVWPHKDPKIDGVMR